MRMAKNTVDYFPHDCHASSGNTMTIIWNKYGYDGYGFWFKLLERLGLAEGHYIDCNDTVLWQLLLVNLGVSTANKHITTEDNAIEILDMFAKLKAIDVDLWKNNKVIWSDNYVENVKDAYNNRRRATPEKPIPTADKALTTAGNPQKKREERKGKEEEDNTLFEIFWNEYPKKVGKGKAIVSFNKALIAQNGLAHLKGNKVEFVDVLIKKVGEQKESSDWLDEDGKYIPNPTTWLNEMRWLDEPKEKKKSHYKRLD